MLKEIGEGINMLPSIAAGDVILAGGLQLTVQRVEQGSTRDNREAVSIVAVYRRGVGDINVGDTLRFRRLRSSKPLKTRLTVHSVEPANTENDAPAIRIVVT